MSLGFGCRRTFGVVGTRRGDDNNIHQHARCQTARNSIHSPSLPSDFPGQGSAGYPASGTGRQKAIFLQSELALDVNEHNFIPNLLVHEFEALLFTQPDQFAEWVDDVRAVERLRAIAKAFATPEDINDDPQTAPSKRMLAAMPRYQKTFHGPLIACSLGLDALRAACPHFHAWLQQLEALAPKGV